MPLLRLVLILLAAAAASSSGECRYGSEPGTWTNYEWSETEQRGPHLDGLLYRRLDDTAKSLWFSLSKEPANAPFGSAWRTLGRDCPLHNVLASFWSQTFVRRTTLMFFGDSNDAHLVNFLCGEYAARGFTGWKAYINSKEIINYCSLPSGLTILQIYVMGVFTGDVHQIHAAREFFTNGTDRSPERELNEFVKPPLLAERAKEIKEISKFSPDLIMLSSSYWTLHQMVEVVKNKDDMTPPLIGGAHLTEFTNRMAHLARIAARNFPKAKLAIRTSHEIRTDCVFGTNIDHSNKRIWGKRAWVSQINAAIRAVARASPNIHLVDLQAIADPFTPRQTTADDIHFKSWLGFELVNVLLNIVR